eukprot:sb/3471488/
MVIVILAVGLCVALCQEKKGPDKLAEKQVTKLEGDGQQKQQRVEDKKNNEKDLGGDGDKQDSHEANQTTGDDKDDNHGDIKNQDAADYHGDEADGDGEGNHGDGKGNHGDGDGEGNHGDGEVHKKTTEKAIVSDKDLINDPAFNVTKIFPTQAPQPVNKVTTLLIMTHGEGKYFLHCITTVVL